MNTDKNKPERGDKNYKDKDEPQWYPGDAGGAHKSTDREQKANKAPFVDPKQKDQ